MPAIAMRFRSPRTAAEECRLRGRQRCARTDLPAAGNQHRRRGRCHRQRSLRCHRRSSRCFRSRRHRHWPTGAPAGASCDGCPRCPTIRTSGRRAQRRCRRRSRRRCRSGHCRHSSPSIRRRRCLRSRRLIRRSRRRRRRQQIRRLRRCRSRQQIRCLRRSRNRHHRRWPTAGPPARASCDGSPRCPTTRTTGATSRSPATRSWESGPRRVRRRQSRAAAARSKRPPL